MTALSRHPASAPRAFTGFASPSSNTLYCPNQFFDVCLPHRSRGCVRTVAYMLRKTLGWSDAQGKPLHEQVAFTYEELIQDAGVSREMIRSAIEEAIRFNFITCLRKPIPKRTGTSAVSGLYELRWDEGGEYVKSPDTFSGFFAGEGNRTYIPNEFFDIVIRTQTLTVIKVVGSVARFSIGFVNKFGHRRTQAALSLTDLQRYAKIGSRSKLVASVKSAIKLQYIIQTDSGFFDPHAGASSRPAVFALRWRNGNVNAAIGPKKEPGNSFPNDRSEKGTGIGQKWEPDDRSEKGTDLQITVTNYILKQQGGEGSGVKVNRKAKGDSESVAACFSSLKEEGFDERTARSLASRFPIDAVLNQIDWIGLRGPAKNRLGLLRRAIEANYPKPEVGKSGRPDNSSPDAELRRRLAQKLTLPKT